MKQWSWFLPLRHLKPAGASDPGGTIKEKLWGNLEVNSCKYRANCSLECSDCRELLSLKLTPAPGWEGPTAQFSTDGLSCGLLHSSRSLSSLSFLPTSLPLRSSWGKFHREASSSQAPVFPADFLTLWLFLFTHDNVRSILTQLGNCCAPWHLILMDP